ncbi:MULTISPECIES: hypothetical protein [Bifidobacterium]|uniref:hypothetical protein n=1 Tax=Bifidobacterium TaxID=1678 RepID=UPI001BDDBDAA|nr:MULTISPECIES: hypothetical protein [Bifidobacterium]MBT1162401.1 hypothetical protein [Bifidobacterium sp. SO1]MBW3079626.1 hypothetical protein [Bifidobacterium simiiventris]
MDERWMKALRAKGINVGVGGQSQDGHKAEAAASHGIIGNRSPVMAGSSRAKPFKATGHKGGISRQGN